MNRSRKISFPVSYEVYEAVELLAAVGDTTVSNTARLMICKDLIECDLIDITTPFTEQAAKYSPLRRELNEIAKEAAR